MKREFEKKIITVYDQWNGIYREFKEGQRVLYVGEWEGTVQEDFSVKLDKGDILPNVVRNQPQKLRKI